MTFWTRLFARRGAERALDAELRDHLARLEAELRAEGLPSAEARRRAALEFGNLAVVKDACRDTRPTRWLEIVVRDLRFGARMLRRHPAFTTAAVLCLALGIGANAAVFSVFDAVFLRPWPYRQPEQLGIVFKQNPDRRVARSTLGPAEFGDWHDQLHAIGGLAMFAPWSPTITGVDQSEQLIGLRASGDLLPMLGVAPLIGRLLTSTDETGGEPVVVISHGLWLRVFAGDRGIVGRVIRLDGQPYKVAGVMPVSFQFPTPQIELWSPLRVDPAGVDRGEIGFTFLARLASGRTFADARAELGVRMQALSREYADTYTGWQAGIMPLRDWYVGDDQRATFGFLIGAVVIVLLTACANVANLLLARGAARRDEIVMRLALGSSHGRVMGQLFAECALLGLCGAGVGLVFSVWVRDAFVNLLPLSSPYRVMPIEVDWRVGLFTIGVSLASVMVSGLLPVRHVVRVTRGQTHGRRIVPSRVRGMLLVCQATATVLLLAGAGVLIQSFLNLWRLDPGFSRANVITSRLSLPAGTPPASQALFFDSVIQQLTRLPATSAVGAVSNLPLGGGGSSNYISIEGHPELHNDSYHPGAERLSVTPGFFAALRVPLIQGRVFDDLLDKANGQLAVVVNRTLAERFYPNESAIGKRIKRGTPTAPFPWMTIVGVVGDLKLSGLEATVGPTIFLPQSQTPVSAMTLVLRTDAPLGTAGAAIRSAVRSVDSNLPVGSVRPFNEIVFASLSDRVFPAIWIASFAALAIVLSAIGVHGVVSCALAGRRREFGLRLALGATERRLVWLGLRHGLGPVAAGCALGLVLALGLTARRDDLVFGLDVADLVRLFCLAAVLPVAVAVLSSLPAVLGVVRQDPTETLRAS